MNQVPPWFYTQSGVIPYRLRNGQPEVMLITSRRRKRWIIPKGVVEPLLGPAQSAVQEAWEEAGLVGRVSAGSIGWYEYQKWGGTCQVEVFLLQVEQVLAAWPEADAREREWLSIEEAARRVDEEELKQIIASLPKSLGEADDD